MTQVLTQDAVSAVRARVFELISDRELEAQGAGDQAKAEIVDALLSAAKCLGDAQQAFGRVSDVPTPELSSEWPLESKAWAIRRVLELAPVAGSH